MKTLTTAAGIALAFFAGSALAADFPSRKAAPVYVPPPPPATWNGLYGGVNIGYGFGDSSREQGGISYIKGTTPAAGIAPIASVLPVGSGWSVPQNLNGVLGGGQVGYNWQYNPWLVVGLESDLQASDVHSTVFGGAGVLDATGAHLQSGNSTKSVDWFGTVRGRIGVTFPSMPSLLVYGTGGFAYGQVVHNVSMADTFAGGLGATAVASGNYDQTRTGWTVGGGVEYMLTGFHPLLNNFSVKIEYLYTDLGTTNTIALPLTGTAAGAIFVGNQISPTRFHTVRAGLNWHFNPFAGAPVLAKY